MRTARRRVGGVAVTALILLLISALSAWAHAGALDKTFSGDGIATVDVTPGLDLAEDVAIQNDGKIVVAGEGSLSGDLHFFVLRFLPNGKLDPTFNGDGKIVIKFGSAQDIVGGVAMAPGGKIVVGGTTRSTNDFAFARLTPTGHLDKTFSGDGKLTLDRDPMGDVVADVAVQGDGKIVFVGRESGFASGVVGRLKVGGTLDKGFASAGYMDFTFGSSEGDLRAVAIRPNGRIIVVGSREPSPDAVGVAQLLPNGTLDSGFGFFGEVTTSFGSKGADGEDVALSGNKLVVVGGRGAANGDDILVLRYTARGKTDPTFGTNGHAVTDLGGTEFATAVAVASNGKVLVVGKHSAPSNPGLVLLRYLPNGMPDASFGTNGKVRPPNTYGALLLGSPAVALQQDGRIMVSDATGPNPKRAWVARFRAA